MPIKIDQWRHGDGDPASCPKADRFAHFTQVFHGRFSPAGFAVSGRNVPCPAGTSNCLPAIISPPLGKTAQRQLLAGLAIRQGPHVQLAPLREEPDRFGPEPAGAPTTADSSWIDQVRWPSRPKAITPPARSMTKHMSVNADRRTRQRSIERPGSHRAQVAGGKGPHMPVGRRHDHGIPGRRRVGDDPLCRARPAPRRPAVRPDLSCFATRKTRPTSSASTTDVFIQPGGAEPGSLAVAIELGHERLGAANGPSRDRSDRPANPRPAIKIPSPRRSGRPPAGSEARPCASAPGLSGSWTQR